MPLFRPAWTVTAVVCAGLLAGCQTGASDAGGSDPSTTAQTSTPPAAAPTTPAAPPATPACPSRAEIADAISKADGSRGVIVYDNIVCAGIWATAPMRYPGSDPSRAIVQRRNGKVVLVTYGTSDLCQVEEMRAAPAKIRRALGPYC